LSCNVQRLYALASEEALQLSESKITGGVKEMVQVEKAEVGGTPYLNRKIVNDKGVKKIKITSEPIFVETEFEGKKSTRLEALCSTQVADPKQVRWQMNPTTQNYMVDKYGSDSKAWIGKEIEVAVKQAGSASPAVYPKECSLEKVIS
jgi:hypothetical protein